MCYYYQLSQANCKRLITNKLITFEFESERRNASKYENLRALFENNMQKSCVLNCILICCTQFEISYFSHIEYNTFRIFEKCKLEENAEKCPKMPFFCDLRSFLPFRVQFPAQTAKTALNRKFQPSSEKYSTRTKNCSLLIRL